MAIKRAPAECCTAVAVAVVKVISATWGRKEGREGGKEVGREDRIEESVSGATIPASLPPSLPPPHSLPSFTSAPISRATTPVLPSPPAQIRGEVPRALACFTSLSAWGREGRREGGKEGGREGGKEGS